jgi:hypothetical protein
VIDVETVDRQKLAELLSASFDGSLDSSEQDVLQLACQHPGNTEDLVGWLKLEAAMRSLESPSVAASLARVLQTRAPFRSRPAGLKPRWLGAALLLVVGSASAAAYLGFRDKVDNDAASYIEDPRAVEPLVNRLPVFVAEDTDPTWSEPEPRDSHDEPLAVEPGFPASVQDSVIARYDFESGSMPPEFKNGQIIEPTMVRAGSRFAAQATSEKYAPKVASVVLRPDEAFIYDDAIVIQFLYWVAAPLPRIRLQVYNHDQRQNYQFDLSGVQHGQWTSAEISLADMKPIRNTVRRLVAGERLSIVYLMGGMAEHNGIIVDDLTVLRKPAGAGADPTTRD